MADRLAVIQAQQSIDELKAIKQAIKDLVPDVKELKTSVSSLNSGFNAGKPREYAAALNELKEVIQQCTAVEKQNLEMLKKLSIIERNNAESAKANAIAKKENAIATREINKTNEQAARSHQKEQKAVADKTSAYKRLSTEGNKYKSLAKNLEAEMLLLTRDFKTGVISQERYNQELAKLQGQFAGVIGKAKLLDSQLKKIDANVGDRQRNVGNYQQAAFNSIKGLDAQIKSMVAMYAGFHAVMNVGSKMLHSNYELSDVLADLQIRLNGDKKATDELFESLKKLDTRTSLGELVNTAAIVAKKGVAKEEIEDITKALDNYFVVAGKEAGSREEGTASIIKLISIFNEDKHITADRVTEISTALVKLQNSGVATGSKMIDIAERIGSVKAMTGVSLPSVLGFAAAIEQLGQRSEVAGNAGMQILMKLLEDMPTYAKMAGVSVKELREAYVNDPFEAVLMVAKGTLKTGDIERITQDLVEVGVRGTRVRGVLGDIAGNADFVRKRVKEAGMAMNEQGYLSDTAAKKQETYAATVDKIGKQFELLANSENFIKFLKNASNLLLNFIKIITAIPFGLVITGLTLMTAAWAYYRGSLIQATITQQWNNSQSLLGIVRNKAARLGLLGETEAIRAHTIANAQNSMTRSLNVATMEAQIATERAAILALEQKIVFDELETIAIRQQIAAKQALIVALEAEIIATNQATIATTGLNAATKASPLGIVLGILALVVPLLFTYAEANETAARKVRTLKENQEELNKALEKGAGNAASEVSELDELYKKATNVTVATDERRKAIEKLKEEYPSYFGKISAEIIMNGKAADSYIELREAIVSAARADAIRDNLKGRMSERLSRDEQLTREKERELALNKKLRAEAKAQKETTSYYQGGSLGTGPITVTLKSSDKLKESDRRLADINQTEKNNKLADDKEDKIQVDALTREELRAKKVREDRISKMGRYAILKEEKIKKEKVYGGAKLTGEQKDDGMLLEAARDNELAINESKFLDGLQSEIEYLKESLRINTNFFDEKIALLKGNNAKEKSLEAKAELEKRKTLKEFTSKIYSIESKEIEENNKKKLNLFERNSEAIQQNDYLTDLERINQLISVDSKMIDELSSYYFTQIELAKDAGEKTIEWERKRDEEIGKIQDNRLKKIKSLSEATVKEYNRTAEMAQFETDIQFAKEKQKIIEDKALTIGERAYRLSQLEKEESIKINENEIKRLDILKGQILGMQAVRALKGEGFALTPDEEKALKEYDALIEKLKAQNAETKRDKDSELKESLQKSKDFLVEGLSGLGMDNLSKTVGDNFDEMWKKIKEGSFSARDAAVLAASTIADALTAMTNRQKENTIAALDEQLKYSQKTSEQEIGFITSRLDALNNLGELTEEQENERRRLEDEARGMKEQQFQREKMIAAQKARAEQKASAQQALINGALAATMTLSQLGFIAGAIPAALALGFGVAQSVSIMAKDPVPQYFVGRDGGKAEWAMVDEKGAELHTDKHGNIKDFGSDNGPRMKFLNEGDKIFTAEKTNHILKRMNGLPKIGENVFRKIALRSADNLQMPIHVAQHNIDYDKLGRKVASFLDPVMSKYSHTTVTKSEGYIYQQRGANHREIIGTYDLKTLEETYK